MSEDIIKKIRTRDGSSTKAAPADRIAAYYGKSVRDFMACDSPDASRSRAGAIAAMSVLLTDDEQAILVAQMRGMISNRAKE